MKIMVKIWYIQLLHTTRNISNTSEVSGIRTLYLFYDIGSPSIHKQRIMLDNNLNSFSLKKKDESKYKCCAKRVQGITYLLKNKD